MRVRQFKNLMNKLGRKKWNVRICPKYSHGEGVLAYLGRYLRGGPISNSRIVEVRDNKVTFNYGRKKRELMTLPVDKFIDRFLQHIPDSNAILVRSYGLYAPGKKDDLLKCREQLGQGPVEEPEKITWQDCFKDDSKHPELCPVCGKRLVVTSIVNPTKMPPRSGAPPKRKLNLRDAA